jgi:hypothetical protein
VLGVGVLGLASVLVVLVERVAHERGRLAKRGVAFVSRVGGT